MSGVRTVVMSGARLWMTDTNDRRPFIFVSCWLPRFSR